MEAKDFTDWIKQMRWSDSEVARRLDLSRNTVAKYKAEGAPASIALACSALFYQLRPWAEGMPWRRTAEQNKLFRFTISYPDDLNRAEYDLNISESKDITDAVQLLLATVLKRNSDQRTR